MRLAPPFSICSFFSFASSSSRVELPQTAGALCHPLGYHSPDFSAPPSRCTPELLFSPSSSSLSSCVCEFYLPGSGFSTPRQLHSSSLPHFFSLSLLLFCRFSHLNALVFNLPLGGHRFVPSFCVWRPCACDASSGLVSAVAAVSASSLATLAPCSTRNNDDQSLTLSTLVILSISYRVICLEWLQLAFRDDFTCLGVLPLLRAGLRTQEPPRLGNVPACCPSHSI